MGDYRKLEVWRLACELSDEMEDFVAELPPRIRQGLGDQLVRAAESIHLNIAEGCGLNTDPQLKKHVRQALGSANEVEDGLAKLKRRGWLRPERHHMLDNATVLRRKLGAFLKRLNDS